MIFKSKQVNTDPLGHVHIRGEFRSDRATPTTRPDHRPEFNVTRDPEPWAVVLTKGHNGHWREWRGIADDWDDALVRAELANPGWVAHTGGFIPRPEYDHPVNRVLVAFRQGRFASLDWFLHEYCHDTDSWLWDGTDAENPTPEEIDHARRVLTRLAGWSA